MAELPCSKDRALELADSKEILEETTPVQKPVAFLAPDTLG
jgi:hypothetical protein